jgi:hypothetical protein
MVRNTRVRCYFSETWYEFAHVDEIRLVIFVVGCETRPAVRREKLTGFLRMTSESKMSTWAAAVGR